MGVHSDESEDEVDMWTCGQVDSDESDDDVDMAMVHSPSSLPISLAVSESRVQRLRADAHTSI